VLAGSDEQRYVCSSHFRPPSFPPLHIACYPIKKPPVIAASAVFVGASSGQIERMAETLTYDPVLIVGT